MITIVQMTITILFLKKKIEYISYLTKVITFYSDKKTGYYNQNNDKINALLYIKLSQS